MEKCLKRLIIALTFAVPVVAQAAWTFRSPDPVESLGSMFYFNGVSADGSRLVGGGRKGFTYDASGFTVLNGWEGNGSWAISISRDGGTAVGRVGRGEFGSAARWLGGSLQVLEGQPERPDAYAHATSDNGHLVGGYIMTPGDESSYQPATWNEAGDLRLLPVPPDQWAGANVGAISADGSRLAVIGHNNLGFVWVDGEGYRRLEGPNNGGLRMTSDGRTIFGIGGSSIYDQNLVRWDEYGVLTVLGSPADSLSTQLTSVSSDGQFVSGRYRSTANVDRPYLWSESTGFVDLVDELTLGGADLHGMGSLTAMGISDDGRTVVGYGYQQGKARGWIAVNTVPEPSALVTFGLGAIWLVRRRRVIVSPC
ncbi:MAG TPA: PEP-CTERM sorting domain-containing protein [Fimbriimonadaceae bacterium]|nr:PEP-CTERM sorting domain-containing protein [Fimbriimonadaceae bacterium]